MVSHTPAKVSHTGTPANGGDMMRWGQRGVTSRMASSREGFMIPKAAQLRDQEHGHGGQTAMVCILTYMYVPQFP